jgi:hypothetical protein
MRISASAARMPSCSISGWPPWARTRAHWTAFSYAATVTPRAHRFEDRPLFRGVDEDPLHQGPVGVARMRPLIGSSRRSPKETAMPDAILTQVIQS